MQALPLITLNGQNWMCRFRNNEDYGRAVSLKAIEERILIIPTRNHHATKLDQNDERRFGLIRG